MGKYILRRVFEMIIVLILVSFLVFIITMFANSDPVYSLMGEDVTPEQYEWAYHHYGFDQPLLVQYFNWAKNFLRGDFGTSYYYHAPVYDLIIERIPVTLFFSSISFLISTLLGVLIGVICAVWQGKFVDTVLTTGANIISSMPSFWMGIMLIFVFSVTLGWLPMTGFNWPWSQDVSTAKALKQMVLPIVCLSLPPIASTARQTRSAMLEVIRQDFIRTARAKGTKERFVILGHGMKNAIIPIMTILGNRLARLVSGSSFVEQIFLIPGIGSLMLGAVTRQDVPLLQATVLFLSAFNAIVTLLVDILYGVVDPRIRLK